MMMLVAAFVLQIKKDGICIVSIYMYNSLNALKAYIIVNVVDL